jgi:hypothetical protein
MSLFPIFFFKLVDHTHKQHGSIGVGSANNSPILNGKMNVQRQISKLTHVPIF